MSTDNPLLSEIQEWALEDLKSHADEFDAIVVGSDSHANAFGAVIAAALKKPLLIVHPKTQTDVISSIVPIGPFHPDMRTLYVDDWCEYGATLARVMSYMCQSRHPNIVAVYEGVRRNYWKLNRDDIRRLTRTFGHPYHENVWPTGRPGRLARMFRKG